MGNVLFKVRKRLAIDFIHRYDLLVLPTFPFIKKLKIGELRIISGRVDHVFIKMSDSKEFILDCYRRLLDIIKVNEYKNVIINHRNMSLISECCSFDRLDICHELYQMMKEYVKDNEFNITIVIYHKKDKKYYFE